MCPVEFHLDVRRSSRANCIGRVDHALFANRIADLVPTGEIEREEREKQKRDSTHELKTENTRRDTGRHNGESVGLAGNNTQSQLEATRREPGTTGKLEPVAHYSQIKSITSNPNQTKENKAKESAHSFHQLLVPYIGWEVGGVCREWAFGGVDWKLRRTSHLSIFYLYIFCCCLVFVLLWFFHDPLLSLTIDSRQFEMRKAWKPIRGMNDEENRLVEHARRG